jgi:ribonuclease HI
MSKINILKIGTDGGCRGNQHKINIGGWGVVLDFNGIRKEIYGGKRNTTNNQMELISVVRAFEAVKDKKISTLIIADSAYVVNCITAKWYINWERNGWRNAKKDPVENKELWVRFLELYRTFENLEFTRLDGHADEKKKHLEPTENEKLNIIADGLANKAMNELENNPDLNEFERIS